MTTKRERLLALAERAERAEGPDRELDGMIWQAVEPNGYFACIGSEQVLYRQDPDDTVAFEAPPLFTASLDAAMTLVPEGWVVGQMSWWPCSQTATVHMDDKRKLKACSGAVSLPLALVSSSLRALAAQEDV